MKTENAKCSSGTWKSFSNSFLSCVHNEGPQGETVAIRREAARLLQPPLSVKLKRSERSESLGDVASFFRNKNIELQQEQTSTSVVLFLSFLLRNRSVPVRQINTVSFFFFQGKKKKRKQRTQLYWRLSRELTKCFVSGFVSQGQSIQRRPAGSLLCGVCAEDFIWELTPFCGCRSLRTPLPRTDRAGEKERMGGKNGKVKRK